MSYARQPNQVSVAGLWLTTFTATLAAILVGGLILGIALRFYIKASIADAFSNTGAKDTKPSK